MFNCRCLTVLSECLTVLLESIDLFDAVNDITQKTLEGLRPFLKIGDGGSNTPVAFLHPMCNCACI